MIRYAISRAALRRAIDSENPTWRTRAAARTDAFEAAGRFTETAGQSIWGEIKPVYMRLQHHKCAYCERLLESPTYGRIDHDLEHFRPKKAVEAWPPSGGPDYDFPTGPAHPGGYYLLAYAPGNYATACKPCNTPLKGSYFPIEGARAAASRRVDDHRSERPLLLDPLGDRGFDPQRVLTFDGMMARPGYKSGRRHRMGVVMIDFFRLNDRDNLLRERAERIMAIWSQHRLQASGDARDHDRARRALEVLTSASAAHTNCGRAFRALCERDEAKASQRFEDALAWLETRS